MARNIFIAALAAGAVSFVAQCALAHPKLLAAVPPADAPAQSPLEIRLTFSEELAGKFSGIDLKDQTGKLVDTGSAARSLGCAVGVPHGIK
jgi:methionine-rich copper-binding protein CopC